MCYNVLATQFNIYFSKVKYCVKGVSLLFISLEKLNCVAAIGGITFSVRSFGGALFYFKVENMICSFFGHRDVNITDELFSATYNEILKALDLGCKTFYFGGYGEFDELCHKIITEIKNREPEREITRIYCVSQERYLRKKLRYLERDNFEDVIFLTPSFSGWYKSIYFRNCAMIDNSDVVIFYAEEREDSGAYKAFKYAKKKKDKHIVNLLEKPHCQ